MKNNKFSVHLKNEKNYFLIKGDKMIDSIVETSLEEAVEYFKETYNGEHIISCDKEEFRVTL